VLSGVPDEDQFYGVPPSDTIRDGWMLERSFGRCRR
jgi:hypothetical protein